MMGSDGSEVLQSDLIAPERQQHSRKKTTSMVTVNVGSYDRFPSAALNQLLAVPSFQATAKGFVAAAFANDKWTFRSTFSQLGIGERHAFRFGFSQVGVLDFFFLFHF